MDTSNKDDDAKSEDIQPSTSANSPKSISRYSGISEFYTTSYAELTKENIERMKLPNGSPKKYYFFDENEKLKVYQIVDSAAIENLTKTEQNFTLQEGLLIFLAAERFNDPTKAKLDGRTEEECIEIFTRIINNPAIFNALQNGFRELNSDQMHELMFKLPFTEDEDSSIKKLNSKRFPTHQKLHNLQRKAFTHFRGRKAIASRYSQLWANDELNEQKFHNSSKVKENTILPFHDKFSASTLKYLTACSTPELNGTLNFVKNLTAISRLQYPNNTRVLGKLTLYEHVYDVHSDKIFVFLADSKLHLQQTEERNISYCSNICISIISDNITFLNAFGLAVVINGTTYLSGHKATFPHKGTFIIAIPKFGVFYYTADSSYVSKPPVTFDEHVSNLIEEKQPDVNKSGVIESDIKLSHKEQKNNGVQPIRHQGRSKITRQDIIEVLRNFEEPSEEFDYLPITNELREKAKRRSIVGLPTTRPSDDSLLPAYALYKYLTYNSSKSELPCDYIAFQRYLKDEMSEKLKLSKFVKSYSTNLSMVPMSNSVSNADSYNKRLQYLLPPSHIRPRKYENDIRFYSKNKKIVVEERKIKRYGDLHFVPPALNLNKINFLPEAKSYVNYNDFNCKLNLLNSFTPGVPKYIPYFVPKPKLVRNELGHPVWINLPEKSKEKPKPPHKPPAKRSFLPPGTLPLRTDLQHLHSRPQFTLHSAPQYSSSNNSSECQYISSGTSASEISSSSSQALYTDDYENSEQPLSALLE